MTDPPGIVIGGVPRSGTTLLRLMLDSHPLLAIPPETHFLREMAVSGDLSKLSRTEVFEAIVGTRRWNDFGISRCSLKDALDSCYPFSVSEGIKSFYRLYTIKLGKIRWGDKTPEYGLILDNISKLLPDSRIIHIVRDGRDVYLSQRSTWFGQHVDIRKHSFYWRNYVNLVEKHGDRCDHFLRIHFEDLVKNPEFVLRNVCEFCDLDFTKDLLRYHKRSGQRLSELKDYCTRSGRKILLRDRIAIHELTSSPPVLSRVARWRSEMSREDVQEYVSIAFDTLFRMGYGLY